MGIVRRTSIAVDRTICAGSVPRTVGARRLIGMLRVLTGVFPLIPPTSSPALWEKGELGRPDACFPLIPPRPLLPPPLASQV